MHSILAVGLDAGLLSTRVAVLNRTGADVTPAIPDAAVEILRVIPFDVVVLCHTLSPTDSRRIALAAHQSADIYVLQLVSNATSRSSYEDVPVDGLCESDPGRLVERVMELLNTEAPPAPEGGKILSFSRNRSKLS